MFNHHSSDVCHGEHDPQSEPLLARELHEQHRQPRVFSPTKSDAPTAHTR